MFDKNAQTKLYNTLMGNPTTGSINNSVGRVAGLSAANGSNKNFFEKKASSIGNAVGTTVSAGASLAHDIGENLATYKFLGDSKSRMNDVAKKYGYNSYQDVWDARDKAEASGDTATLDFIDNTINPELQAQANANAEEATAKAKGYEDYRKNNLVSQNINQDRGKFLGSAINTLSTGVDIAGLGATPLTNAVQGGIEGVADELEQNGFENFDWGRAGQNALIGAASGAVTGAVNNTGVMKNLGQGKITQKVLGSKLGQKVANNAVGNAIRTVGTGAVKGAISGAVGGATGAGVSSAINGVELGQGIANTFQGAAEGAKQGALTGGAMAGANMLASKTPLMQKINQANEDWKNSGENFKERWQNTREQDTWGNRLIDNTKARLQNGALSIKDASAEMNNANPIDYMSNDTNTAVQKFLDTLTPEGQIPTEGYAYGKNASARREAIASLRNEFTDGELATLMNNETDPKLKALYADAGGQNPSSELTDWGRVIKELDAEGVPFTSPRYQAAWEEYKKQGFQVRTPVENSNTNDFDYVFEDARGNRARLPELRQSLNPDGNTVIANSDLIDSPIRGRMYDNMSNQDFINYAEQNGWKLAETPYQGMSPSQMLNAKAQEAGFENYDAAVRNYTDTGESAKGTDIVEWMDAKSAQQQASPETEIYRTLSNKTNTEGKLRNAAGLKLQKQYGTIDKPTAKATNAPETLQKIANAGFTKPADVERMADVITGSNGELSKLVSNLVATAEPVNTFDGETSSQTFDDFIDNAIQRRGLDGINEGKAVKSQINALMRSLPSRANGSVDFTDSPSDVFKLTQLLDSEAANYEGRSGMNYGTTTPDKLRAAQVIKDASNLLKNRIYDTVNVESALTPEVAANLKAYAPNNKAWANYVDNEVMTAKNAQDLRSLQSPWVRAKKIIDNGYMNSVTFGGRNGGSSGMPSLTKRGITGAILDATVNSQPALRLQAKALNKAADFVANNPSNNSSATTPNVSDSSNGAVIDAVYNPSTQIYNAIGREIGQGEGEQARAAAYLSDAVQEAETTPTSLEGLIAPSTGTATSVYNNVYGQPSTVTTTSTPTTGGYFQATGDYWTDLLGNAMSRAIDADDVTAFATLYGMYQDALSKNTTSGDKSLSDLTVAQQTQMAKLESADTAINELEDLFNKAGGGKGPIIGNLQSIGGDWGLDSNARTYNQLSEGLVNQIAQAIGKTDSLNTEGEVKRALQLIPQLTDDATTAKNKLEELRRMLASTKASYNAAYGLTS